MREVQLRAIATPPPGALPVEIVEQKGLGHPDSICDSLAEELSLALTREYAERFGAVLHHNVDKALLVGGRAAPIFGGGDVLEPIEIFWPGARPRPWAMKPSPSAIWRRRRQPRGCAPTSMPSTRSAM